VLEKLKSPLPVTYRALAPFSAETPISVRVDVGDVVYLEPDRKKPLSSADVISVKCIHRAQTIFLPSDFLQTHCECVPFEDYYFNTYQQLQTAPLVRTSSSTMPSSPLSSTSSPISSLNSSTDKSRYISHSVYISMLCLYGYMYSSTAVCTVSRQASGSMGSIQVYISIYP
jgi:hypothetical protein